MLHITQLKATGLKMRRPIRLLEGDMQVMYRPVLKQQALDALNLETPLIPTLLKTT